MVEIGINVEFLVGEGHATAVKFLNAGGDLMAEGPRVR